MENMTTVKKDTTSTFVNNMKLPIHRWYRFSAGFSAEWAKQLIQEQVKQGRKNVLDPFAGSGTTLLEAQNIGVDSYGLEAHPFIYKIAEAKLSWNVDTGKLFKAGIEVLNNAQTINSENLDYPTLIGKCYPNESLEKLDRLRRIVESLDSNLPINKLIWLTLVSILRTCAPVGTANWQYVLPNRKSAKIVDPYTAFEQKLRDICKDIDIKKRIVKNETSTLLNEDARKANSLPEDWVELVVTSPPYANNYDYADATRLELSFFKLIDGWGDLQTKIRPSLIRSCTQHVTSYVKNTDEILQEPILNPISNEIWNVCKSLEAERLNYGGKKNYHTMIATYFYDIANVLNNLRPKCKDNSLQCWVVGDSAPYGIYAPVDEWIGKLAVSAGFKGYSFEKTRDRNVKWKNRKHTVPLKEGRLWIKG